MPVPQSRDEFKASLRRLEALQLARSFVLSEQIHALPTVEKYIAFKDKVAKLLPDAQLTAIVGSGNWRYSLNPDKLLNEYHNGSDIDVAVVSEQLYFRTWESIRRYHRENWYTLSDDRKASLLRNGQNIYSGFACPTWLPVRGHPSIYEFKTMLNKLSGPEVGYREVKMFYFRNQIEMLDYYQRGFLTAKRAIK